VSSRPKRLSVTRIARLLRDPYWAYAYYVLRLRPLPPLGRIPGPAERGQLAHKVVERFARQYPDAMPDNAADILRVMAEEETARTIPDAALRTIWGIQLARAMDWFAARDSQLRETVQKDSCRDLMAASTCPSAARRSPSPPRPTGSTN
jgi:ATP-dependent helicase/nuclease subunit B